MRQVTRHSRRFVYPGFILFLMIMLHGVVAMAQVPFQRTSGLPGRDSPYSVLPVSDGYLVAGVTNSAGEGEFDIMMLKTDLNFNTIWSNTYGGAEDDLPRSLIACSDGGYLIVGNTKSFSPREEEMLIMKFDPNVNLEWAKTYGKNDIERGFCAIETSDGYLIGGNTTSGNGALAIRVDYSGNVIWSRTYGFDENSTRFFNVLRADNGNYIFDSPFESTAQGYNYMMIEITPSGDLVKAKSFKAPLDDKSRDIIKVDGEGYYILGHTNSFGMGSSYNLLLLKTDLNGNYQWANNYESAEDLWASQIYLTSSNELLLTCQSDQAKGAILDIIILKCDLDGNLIWSKRYGGDLPENQNLGNHETLHEVNSNLFVQFGKTITYGMGSEDMYIVGFDRDGNTPCHVNDYPMNVTPPELYEENIALPVNDFNPVVNVPSLVMNPLVLVDTILCPLDPPPLALLSSSDSSFCKGGCIDFTDLSAQDPDQWEWYFEGGVPDNSTAQFPSGICYPDTGCFNVQLIVSNAGGSDTLLLEELICVYDAPVFTLGNDTSLCFTDILTLNAPAGYPNYIWNTGSTVSSIEVSNAGTYWVRIEDDYGCVASDTIVVDFNSMIFIDLGPDSTICDGDSVVLSVGSGYEYYMWQDGTSESDYVVRSTGEYWLEVRDDLGCSGTDTVYVEVAPLPIIYIGNDTLICDGNTIILDAGEGFQSYLWQDGSTQQVHTVDTTGNYWVDVTTDAGCTGGDSAYIEVVVLPELSIGNDTAVCDEFSILLDAGSGFDEYYWQDGSQSPTNMAIQFGEYWVIVDKDGCLDSDTISISEDCPSLIWFPNSFTPNGDGMNDVFLPVYDHVQEYQLYIYNRWGQLMFETNNIDQGWDGTLNGGMSPAGVYIFIVEYIDNQEGATKVIKGSVALLQ